jgi:nicotinamide mononucleotide transporter
MEAIWSWFTSNYIEILATIAGLGYIFLSIKQNIWLWPVGIVNVSLYIYVFFVSKFYADMGLQFFYLFISFYGWYNWLKGNREEKNADLPVIRITKNRAIILFIISLIIMAVIAYILVNFTDSDIPYWDAFTTAFSITATWMLARKIIEHWLIWIVVDLVSAGLYIYKGLYPTTVLFLVFTILAIIGYVEWKKDLCRDEKS